MVAGLPLPTLLSQALVAFTIECDNESERQMPHRTTNHGSTPGALHKPWLVSLVMWSNCMQFIGEEGVRVGELENLARTPTNLNGMERWGYIVVAPDPSDKRARPPRSAWLIRATAAGRKAQEVWRPLTGAIETRWRERFGKDAITQLRASLWDVLRQIDQDLPDCLPILGYGLFSKGPKRTAPASYSVESALPFPALLARVLLTFAIEFEAESDLSLAICANVLRVLGEDGVQARDLPFLTGVSKEAIATALGFLQKRGTVAVEPERRVRLTQNGMAARDAYRRLLGAIETQWRARFGEDTMRALRESLERLQGEPLLRAIEPYPDGWRASMRKPNTLPHYPMVLHRGGFPDGS